MLELNKMYNMNCMDGMARIPEKYFDLAICDPPYGIRVSNNIGRRKKQAASGYEKVHWDNEPPSKQFFKELSRVSKNQIIFGVNHFANRFDSNGRGWIVWDKKISEKTTFSQGELIYTSFNRPLRIFRKGATGGANAEPRIVPTQKPIDLYSWLLQQYAKPGDKILSTHGGSASDVLAFIEGGFDYIWFEIDPRIYEKAKERVEAAVAQIRVML